MRTSVLAFSWLGACVLGCGVENIPGPADVRVIARGDDGAYGLRRRTVEAESLTQLKGEPRVLQDVGIGFAGGGSPAASHALPAHHRRAVRHRPAAAAAAWNLARALAFRLAYGASFLGKGTRDVAVNETHHELTLSAEGRLHPKSWFVLFAGLGPGMYLADVSTTVINSAVQRAATLGPGVAWSVGTELLFRRVTLRIGTGGLVRPGGHDQTAELALGMRL